MTPDQLRERTREFLAANDPSTLDRMDFLHEDRLILLKLLATLRMFAPQ